MGMKVESAENEEVIAIFSKFEQTERIEKVLENYIQLLMDKASKAQVPIPERLELLTPYFSFRLFDVPSMHHDFLKEYYSKSCQICDTNRKQNAVCLLCGATVCYSIKDNVCTQNREDARSIEIRAHFFLQQTE
jgi:hypothetical protein